jgi:hypothetical protein
MSNELVPVSQNLSAFSNAGTFEEAQRMAKLLSSSDLVPQQFRGPANLGNCVIALEMAQRIGASPLAVMQSIYVVHGKPSWSAQFIIAALNASKRFSPLRFSTHGEADSADCYAWATELATGERLEGPKVSIEMARIEGWYEKNGSKWKTMPELMLRYRAATFFGRLYAPDILCGMQTQDELDDIKNVTPIPVSPTNWSTFNVPTSLPTQPIEEVHIKKMPITDLPFPDPLPPQGLSLTEKLLVLLGEYVITKEDYVRLMVKAKKAPRNACAISEITDENIKWSLENMEALVKVGI